MSSNPFDVYLFDDAMRAWRDLTTGRTVATAAVQAEVQTHIDAAKSVISTLTDQMRAGEISIGEWKMAVASELKDMHGAFAMLGAGGRDNMTPGMWGEVGSRLKQEYIYLNKFAGEIADGTVSPGQMDVRLDMYMHDAYGSYADANRTLNINEGMTEEIRILDDGAEHCDDCEAAAGHWETIGTLPDIGNSQCGSRCRCSFDFR